MTLEYVHRATIGVFAFSLVAVGPAYAQRRDGSLLPQNQSGQVTAVGCLVRGDAVRGGKKDKYTLARPRRGPVASVPEASCTVDSGADALTLDNPEKASITDAMIGHWVEIGGRLESETDKDPDNLRELDVLTAKLVPVVIPRPAAQPAPPLNRPRQRRDRADAGAGADAHGTGAASTSSQEAAEDGEPSPGDGIGRIALAGGGLHSSVVPSQAPSLMRTRTTTQGTTVHAVAPFVVVR